MRDRDRDREEVFTNKMRAGKRTYFFDVRATRKEDYYITITESKRRFDGRGYDKHKIFLYKEDFHKFLRYLTDTIDHVKTELIPDYDYDEFNREPEEYDNAYENRNQENADSGSNFSAEPEAKTEEVTEEAGEEVMEEAGEEEAADNSDELSTSWD